jgi:hypothetical protein
MSEEHERFDVGISFGPVPEHRVCGTSRYRCQLLASLKIVHRATRLRLPLRPIRKSRVFHTITAGQNCAGAPECIGPPSQSCFRQSQAADPAPRLQRASSRRLGTPAVTLSGRRARIAAALTKQTPQPARLGAPNHPFNSPTKSISASVSPSSTNLRDVHGSAAARLLGGFDR